MSYLNGSSFFKYLCHSEAQLDPIVSGKNLLFQV